MLTPFSQIAFDGISWGKMIHGIAIISVIALLIQIAIKNRKRPDIKIRPVVAHSKATLEIYNNGGISRFKAVAKIIKNHHDNLNDIYRLFWEPGGNEEEIGRDGIGKIIIAHQGLIISNPRVVGLQMPKIANDGKTMIREAPWEDDTMGRINKNKPPNDIDLEISISADKDMRRKFSGLIFRLSQNSPTDLQFEYVESKTRNLKLDKYGYWK